MPRWRSLASNFLVLALGVVLALGLGEVLVRVVIGDLPDLLDKTDPVLGSRYRRGVVATRTVDGRRVKVRINSAGFNSPEVPLARTAGTHRLVFLGDSFTGATEVPVAQGFHQRAAALLTKRGGVPVEAVNLGVSGFGTAQELLCWRTVGQAYRPDVAVLCVFVGNDIQDNSPTLAGARIPFFDFDAQGQLSPLPFRPHWSKSSGWLRQSALYKWQKLVVNTTIAERLKHRGALPRYNVFRAPADAAWTRAWAITEGLLHLLATDTKQQGVPLLVVLLPDQVQVDEAAWQATLRRYPSMAQQTWDLGYPQRRLTAACQQEGLPVLDLQGVFRLASRHQQLYNRSDPHFSVAGHALAGLAIADRVAAGGWLPEATAHRSHP